MSHPIQRFFKYILHRNTQIQKNYIMISFSMEKIFISIIVKINMNIAIFHYLHKEEYFEIFSLY